MPARYQSRRRRGAGNSNSSGNSNSNNRTTNQNNGGNKRTNCNKTEFRFQLHDPQQRGTYTFEKTHEAIVIKVQKEFKESRLLSRTLRLRVKEGPALPIREISTKEDAEQKRVEQETFDQTHDSRLNYWNITNSDYEN